MSAWKFWMNVHGRNQKKYMSVSYLDSMDMDWIKASISTRLRRVYVRDSLEILICWTWSGSIGLHLCVSGKAWIW